MIENQAVQRARELPGINIQKKAMGKIKKNKELFALSGAADLAGISLSSLKQPAPLLKIKRNCK